MKASVREIGDEVGWPLAGGSEVDLGRRIRVCIYVYIYIYIYIYVYIYEHINMFSTSESSAMRSAGHLLAAAR